MNKDTAHLYLPLVQALADGKTIQMADVILIDGSGRGWGEMLSGVDFTEPPEFYRIKPEPPTFWINEKTETLLTLEQFESDEWQKDNFTKYIRADDDN